MHGCARGVDTWAEHAALSVGATILPLCQDRCRAGFSQIWGRETSVSRGNTSEIFTSV